MTAGAQPDPIDVPARQYASPPAGGTELPTHAHLWTLDDGTPSHAPPGRLSYDPDGQVACHLCGHPFRHLGAHVRAHGWTAARYREAVGLHRGEPLCSRDVSNGISLRQRATYRRDPAARARLAAGIELARSGDLSDVSVRARRLRRDAGREPASVTSMRGERLRRGREQRSQARAGRLADLVARAGARDLHDLLRSAYLAGGTLESLRALTGLGRGQVRAELEAAGVDIRRPGHNILDNQRRRAADIDEQVARRLGVADVRGWLVSQRNAGRSVAYLAAETGRSVAWVRARLEGRSTTGTPPGRAGVANVSRTDA